MHLNEQSSLCQQIARLYPFDNEKIWELVGKATDKQAKLLWALVYKKDVEQLKSVIADMSRFYAVKETSEPSN